MRAGETPGPIFDDLAHAGWDVHLLTMHDFRETVLFGASVFRGNPLVRSA